MKLLAVALVIALAGCSATHQPYAKVGIGYKVTEAGVSDRVVNSPAHHLSCLAEVGFDVGEVSYGIRHLSQCFVGYPFNERKEYTRNSVFLDYKYVFKR